MKFSIIICTYNSAKKLSKSLDSVLVQTFDDYEVVIVDGASTDGTIEIIKEYEKKFAGKLRWISEKDGGIYEAMNKGVKMARGEWIYFLGSDDVLFDKMVLEKVAENTNEKNLSVIYGDVFWGETGRRYAGKFSVLKIMRQNICHQAMFFRRDIFSKFGNFEVKYSKLADYVFNMRWFNDESIGRKYLDLVVAVFAEGGASSTPDENFIKDRSQLIEKFFPPEYFQLDLELENLKERRGLLERNKQLEREIELMKSSKFWKLREKYLAIKNKLGNKLGN